MERERHFEGKRGYGNETRVIVLEDEVHQARVSLGHEEIVRAGQFFLVPEVLPEEVQDEVAGGGVVGRVHGHLADEVHDVGVLEDDGGDSVPEVVKGEDGFGAGL